MFLSGLVMVTNAGIYILQLFDNHAATYSALIIGCSEVDNDIPMKNWNNSFAE